MGKDVLAGVDVGSEELVVALDIGKGEPKLLTYPNDPGGHNRLCLRLKKSKRLARVCMESTGVYGLNLAVTLYQTEGIEVMVANPRLIRDFGKASFQRSKTDLCDARVILEFLRRMPFTAWKAPDQAILDLRAITRRISRLTVMMSQERNRRHAADRCGNLDPAIHSSIDRHLEFLQESIDELTREGLEIVDSHEVLSKHFNQLLSVKGIAQTSGLRIVSEVEVLPEEMGVRQWVAHAGLDPRHCQSGTSLNKPSRISRMGNKHLRAALYMPALVAAQHEPNVKAFYEKLIGRGKKPMQANVAVMRKLLHSIHGMFKNGESFKPEKFYAIQT